MGRGSIRTTCLRLSLPKKGKGKKSVPKSVQKKSAQVGWVVRAQLPASFLPFPRGGGDSCSLFPILIAKWCPANCFLPSQQHNLHNQSGEQAKSVWGIKKFLPTT